MSQVSDPLAPVAFPAPARAKRASDAAALWVQVTLCVVVGALLLAVVAIPRLDPGWKPAPEDVRGRELRTQIGQLRAAIFAYHRDHAAWPGGETAFAQQVERYLGGPIPINPVNDLSSVRIVGEDESWPDSGDRSVGWLYAPRTGEIRAGGAGTIRGTVVRFYDL